MSSQKTTSAVDAQSAASVDAIKTPVADTPSDPVSDNQGAQAVDIKDYLLDKIGGEFVKPAGLYKVLLQTDTDFIVTRKRARGEREMAVLISEGLFYFREKSKVEDITHDKLCTFLKDLGGDAIKLEQVAWLSALNSHSIQCVISVITNSTNAAMCRAGVLDSQMDFYWCSNYWGQNKKLFTDVIMAARSAGVSSYSSQALVATAFEIEKRYGVREALYFTEVLKTTAIEQYRASNNRYSHNNSSTEGFFQLLDEPYNLELRDLIDYIFVDAFSQGIVKVDGDFWHTYEKYLRMQMQLFGEIRDKHPRYLMTAHNIIEQNVNLLEHISADKDFAELAAEVRGLEHEGKVYSIVAPATARQIAEDSIALGHCTGSHARRIASGDMHVLFMRSIKAKEQPLVTLRFCKEQITGAEGLHRRGLTADEREFLESWAKEKDVQIAA